MAEFEPKEYPIIDKLEKIKQSKEALREIIVLFAEGLTEDGLHPVIKLDKVKDKKNKDKKTRTDREPTWIVKKLHPDEPGEMVIKTKIFRGGTTG